MQRWTTSYRFDWTPIVTFSRRQLALLDWIEENLDPVAFYDHAGTIGVAVLSRDIRLTVTQRGMTLEDGAVADEGVSVLQRAVEGALETLEPRDVGLTSGSVAWSRGFDGLVYNEARAGLARTISGLGLVDGAPVPIDVSALMDVLTPDFRGQVEWGVVSADELLERLSQPPMGRLSTNRPELVHPGLDPDDLPDASLFVDTTFSSLAGEHVAGVKGIFQAIDELNSVSGKLAEALYSQVSTALGGQAK